MEVFPFILRDVIFTCFEVFCSEMYIFWMDLFTFFCYWIYSKWNQNLTLPIARDTTFYIFTDLRSYISRGIIQVIFTTTPNSHKVKGIIRNDIDTKFFSIFNQCDKILQISHWIMDGTKIFGLISMKPVTLFFFGSFWSVGAESCHWRDLYIPIMATCKLRHIFPDLLVGGIKSMKNRFARFFGGDDFTL